MSWSKKGRRRRGYHHGNLREALVQAALDLIAEYGPAGFTFAEAARAAGVIRGMCLAFSPNGGILAVGACNGSGKPSRVTLWEATTGRLIHTLSGHRDDIYCINFSPDGRWLGTGARSKSLKVWDVSRFTRTLRRSDIRRRRAR